MKIKISSPCMAMIAYEATKAQGHAEGCLCGELATEVTKNITDSDVTTTTEEVLSVHSVGSLNLSRQHDNKLDSNDKVFGWYKFCRRPLMRLSIREKSIHRKLANNLKCQNSSSEHVVTILIQERWSENQSTYLWKFAAFLQKDRWFIPCKMEIVNLKATSCGSYKPYPSIHHQHRLPQVTQALTSLSTSFTLSNDSCSFHMVDAVRRTSNDIVKSIGDTINKLSTVEDELEDAHSVQKKLKQDLEELRAQRRRNLQNANVPASEKPYYIREESKDSDNSDSSDSAEYYGEEKASQLLQDMQPSSNAYDDTSGNREGAQASSSNVTLPDTSSGEAVSPSLIPGKSETEAIVDICNNNSNPTPHYDPFDNLVSIVKADLEK